MTNVFNLGSYRKPKTIEVDDSGFFTDVDFRDVVRHSTRSPQGEFLDGADDAISLGTTAKEQVRRIFSVHGLRTMPSTWAELIGNLNYCSLLDSWLTCFSESQPPGMRELATDDHNQAVAGRGELLGLLADGDLDGAWDWHKAHDTFAQNAQDPALNSEAQ